MHIWHMLQENLNKEARNKSESKHIFCNARALCFCLLIGDGEKHSSSDQPQKQASNMNLSNYHNYKQIYKCYHHPSSIIHHHHHHYVHATTWFNDFINDWGNISMTKSHNHVFHPGWKATSVYGISRHVQLNVRICSQGCAHGKLNEHWRAFSMRHRAQTPDLFNQPDIRGAHVQPLSIHLRSDACIGQLLLRPQNCSKSHFASTQGRPLRAQTHTHTHMQGHRLEHS